MIAQSTVKCLVNLKMKINQLTQSFFAAGWQAKVHKGF
jgi:hypothetical protein